MARHHIKKSVPEKIAWAIFYLITAVILISAAYPMYFVVIASFSDPNALAMGKIWLFPDQIQLLGYQKVFEYEPLWTGYRNTIIYTISTTALSLAVTMPAAYAMSRKDFIVRNKIMVFFTIPMFFSGGMVPTYLLMKRLNLLDNPLVLIIPSCFGIYNMIIARTFFQSTIPGELLDAAQIDGCGNARFFVSIVLPLSKAILAVIGLYVAVGTWNSYFSALLYIRNNNYMPLQIALRNILIANSFNMRQGTTATMTGLQQQRLEDLMKYCVIVVSTVPIMCVYPFVQKYFAKGVMIGAIKG